MRFTKNSVQFHADHMESALPAIDVKIRRFDPGTDDVVREFGCTEEQAEQALKWAFESAQTDFWNVIAPDLAFEYLAPHHGPVDVGAEGRSGGWLGVDGLDDFETWDAIKVSAWGRFETAIHEAIKDLCSWESISERIRDERWAESGSREYNFVFIDGQRECLVDLVSSGRACPNCGHVL